MKYVTELLENFLLYFIFPVNKTIHNPISFQTGLDILYPLEVFIYGIMLRIQYKQ